MAFQKMDDYPDNFRNADENGRVHVVECSRQDARALIDILTKGRELEGDDLTTAIDEAQGGADEKAHYLIIKVNPGSL